MKKELFILLLIFAACSTDEITPTTSPNTGDILVLSFQESTINISQVDSAYALLDNGTLLVKKYFEKKDGNLIASLTDLNGTWDASLFVYTKATATDYPRQYFRDKALLINGQPIDQKAPNGSLVDTWFPRAIIGNEKTKVFVGLAPDDPHISISGSEFNKWDYFTISKQAYHRDGGSVLVGDAGFEINEPINPPWVWDANTLDLSSQIGSKNWNEIEIFGLLMNVDVEDEEFLFYCLVRN